MESFLPPLITCEPVLTEAGFLLARLGVDPATPLELLERGVLQIGFPVEERAATLRNLMRRYRSVPMSLADACLVLLSEMHDEAKVWTLDSHFSLYRRHGRRLIATLMP
jgi:predicted nucleic acid-binding protein